MTNKGKYSIIKAIMVMTGCSNKETENIKDTSVVEKFDEGRIGFYSNGHWGMEIKSIDNQSKTITYDGYESTDGGPACVDRQGTIVDSDTLDIQGVILKWEGDTFTIEKEEKH